MEEWKEQREKKRRLAITPWTWDNAFLDNHSIPKCQAPAIALQASFSDKMTKLSQSILLVALSLLSQNKGQGKWSESHSQKAARTMW
jgi:hypothetical protein